MPQYKVQMMGGSRRTQRQPYISLPTSWIRDNDIVKGDKLEVVVDDDTNTVIISIPEDL